MDKVATVDLTHFRKDPSSSEAIDGARAIAQSLAQTGIVFLREPRIDATTADAFLDMLEDYFDQPDHLKAPDQRSELHYQVGTTPEFVEVPLCKAADKCKLDAAALSPTNRPAPIGGADPKWRFFWRVGERPTAGGGFEDLNAAPVVPAAFPQWAETMDNWGSLMLGAVTTCAEMAAVGFSLPRDAFSRLMVDAPHLLAPTGSDLGKYNAVGTTLAGWHDDLNLLTIHYKSRYPGLHAWLRDGTKFAVKIPTGCLLVQAGQQLEYLTAGHVLAGMHEVVVTEATLAAAEKARAAKRPTWRISSTLFGHVASAATLEPLGHFGEREGARQAYPPVLAGEQVRRVLEQIELKSPETH